MVPMAWPGCDYVCNCTATECEVCNTPVRQALGLHLVDILRQERFCSRVCLNAKLELCENNAHRMALCSGILYEFAYRHRDAFREDARLRDQVEALTFLVKYYSRYLRAEIASIDCSDGPGSVRV